MAIDILSILKLLAPFSLEAGISDFGAYYVIAEGLITLSQGRDSEIQNLYDVIIAAIGDSQISNSKGTKTWFSDTYKREKNTVNLYNASYYLKLVVFVGKLQELVLDRYDSLDEFYQTEGITVSQIFADISEDAGYPLSPQYIEEIS
jgi:hypothetical protein